VAVAVAGYVWFRVIPQTTGKELGGVRADYAGVTGPSEQLTKIARARALASLTDLGTQIMAGMALSAGTTVIAMVVLHFTVPGFDTASFWSGAIPSFSALISASLAIGLVLLVVQAYRSRPLRKVVAILWDVVTFWPRANHPLTPPSYGARTVWDVRLRLAALTDTADTRVVLVAHSQGTVIAAATLLQANTPTEHYPLLTFGSPLRRLYAQNFPAYFGAETLRTLRLWQLEPNHQWINLWAHTDPIGAWIFDDHNADLAAAQRQYVDCRLLDVKAKDEPTGLVPEPGAPICGHSGFWTRPEYKAAVDALQATVMPEASVPPDTRAIAPPMEQYV
jgi:pimeloyl-ACP methyl ester carboxylesterase